jgi:hypothetical protein
MKTVVALGDLHCGHVAGLTPPGYMKRIEKFPSIYQLSSEMWTRYKAMVKKYYAPDVLIANGDLIDGRGEKSGGTELLVTDQKLQCNMAIECLKMWNAKKIILTYGTPYHTSHAGEDYEDIISDKLGAEIHNHAQIQIHKTVFDVKHHVGGSSSPVSENTAISKEHLWNLLWADIGSCEKADIVLRSHAHYFTHCGNEEYLAMILPALQAPSHNKHGGRKCSRVVKWGLVKFNIKPQGGFSWEPEIIKLENAKSELIKA